MYWDANGSARLRDVAREAVGEFLSFGGAFNPSSIHKEGRKARKILRESRDKILKYLNLSSEDVELCFTSGGTEACSSLLNGFLPLFEKYSHTPHIISSSIEHTAMLEPLRRYENNGFKVSYISPNENSEFNLLDFKEALKKETELVSLMAVNNETGAVLPLKEVISILRDNSYSGVIISDCTQAISKSDISFNELFSLGLDAISISAHKIGALPGIGAIIFSKKTCRLYEPLILGGPQEGKKRGGTEFVLGAYVFGLVCEHLRTKGEAERKRRREARDLLFSTLKNNIPDCKSYTPFQNAIDNTILIHIPECRGDDLVVSLDIEGVSVSIGSACSSGKQDVSHVLLSMGIPKNIARECIRISLDWDITNEEVLSGADKFTKVVERMRSINFSKDNLSYTYVS